MTSARFAVVSWPAWMSAVQEPIRRSGLESGEVHHLAFCSRVWAAAGAGIGLAVVGANYVVGLVFDDQHQIADVEI